MGKAEEILEKLRLLSRGNANVEIGKVLSVDRDKLTCEIEIDDISSFTCYLSAVESSIKGFVTIPALDSFILAVRLDEEGNYYCLLLCSTVDEIIMRDGENGGLVNIESLISKMNTIEDDINALKNVFKTTWIPVAQDGGSALKTAVSGWANNTIIKTDKSDIEDDKILH